MEDLYYREYLRICKHGHYWKYHRLGMRHLVDKIKLPFLWGDKALNVTLLFSLHLFDMFFDNLSSPMVTPRTLMPFCISVGVYLFYWIDSLLYLR